MRKKDDETPKLYDRGHETQISTSVEMFIVEIEKKI